MLKTIVLLMLSTFALSSGASGCHAKPNAALPTQTPNTEASTKALKVLEEGFHSAITHPFIAIVRDSETYAALSKLEGNLPKLGQDFFERDSVIAAFLGERNTGYQYPDHRLQRDSWALFWYQRDGYDAKHEHCRDCRNVTEQSGSQHRDYSRPRILQRDLTHQRAVNPKGDCAKQQRSNGGCREHGCQFLIHAPLPP